MKKINNLCRVGRAGAPMDYCTYTLDKVTHCLILQFYTKKSSFLKKVTGGILKKKKKFYSQSTPGLN
jgi:hypothetical protein